MPSIYLDHAATTPVDPRVVEAMTPFFSGIYGNPSSMHKPGQRARRALDEARNTVAEILSCTPREIIFTGSGTESDNLAILGIAEAYADHGKHIITGAIEHEAVLGPLGRLEKKHGYKITRLPVDKKGIIKLEELKKTLTPETVLVTIMYANNEIGTIEPIREVVEIVQSYKKTLGRSDDTTPIPPFVHTDACQAAGAFDLNVQKLGVDLLTLNGSKIYGPKGTGALFLRKNIKLSPQILGGEQEHSHRAGTENVPGWVGLAEALKIAHRERETENARLAELRNHLIFGITSSLKDVALNGDPEKRLPNNASLTVKGVDASILIVRLDLEGIYVSGRSACTTGSDKPSHVLKAIGLSDPDAFGTIRFSLGRSTTKEEIDHVIKIFVEAVNEIRSESGMY